MAATPAPPSPDPPRRAAIALTPGRAAAPQLRQPFVNPAPLIQYQQRKVAVALTQGGVAIQDLFQVPVQETVFPHVVQDAFKVADLVRIGQVAVGWRHQQ